MWCHTGISLIWSNQAQKSHPPVLWEGSANQKKVGCEECEEVKSDLFHTEEELKAQSKKKGYYFELKFKQSYSSRVHKWEYGGGNKHHKSSLIYLKDQSAKNKVPFLSSPSSQFWMPSSPDPFAASLQALQLAETPPAALWCASARLPPQWALGRQGIAHRSAAKWGQAGMAAPSGGWSIGQRLEWLIPVWPRNWSSQNRRASSSPPLTEK